LLFKKTKFPTLNSYNKNFEDLIKKNKNFFNFINIK
jgi:hypothetical protein